MFNQISGFYSIMFNNEFDLKPNHASLYMFLLNQNNRSGWTEWFKCPFDLAMNGSGINSRKTYYNCLGDLQKFDLIEYEKGINSFKAPKIKIIDLSTVVKITPLSEPLDTHLPTPLPTPLPTHIYRLITNNLKLITNNFSEFEKLVNNFYKKENEKRKEEISPQCKKYFLDFYKKEKGVDFYWTIVEQKNLNQLIQKIRTVSGNLEDKKVLDLFYSFIDKIKFADKWIFDNLSIRILNQKFNELIPKMRKISAKGIKQNIPDGYNEMMEKCLKTLNDE